jgi:hypothetical protein
MKQVLFALAAAALLAGCAAPRAYSSATTQSTEAEAPSESSAGAGGAEPRQARPERRMFSTDDVQEQRLEYEAWEAGG